MAKLLPLQQQLLKQISYSSCMAIHGCPRKMELKKLLPRGFSDDIIFDFGDGDAVEGAAPELEKKIAGNATFAYGKAVGTGIQEWLVSHDRGKAIFATFMAWDVDLDDESQLRVKKTFETAVLAVQKFASIQSMSMNLDDYELMYYEGKPAIELGFRIRLPHGFVYRGFIDAVLRNKYTGEIIVLEAKTTGMRFVNAAQYQNSEQGVSYALVLDKLFGKMSSYSVLYCAYLTMLERWETFLFPKSPAQRAEWFGNTFNDVETVTNWIEHEYFPRRGECCAAYGKACEFIDTCHLDMQEFYVSEAQAQKLLAAEEVAGKYVADITLDELIQAQLDME